VPPTTAPTHIFTAHHAFVYDSTNATNIYTLGSMDDRIYPASITKLLTSLVALQHLSPDTKVTVGSALYTVPADSSRAFLQMGDVLTVEQLIYGMLLPSGNDAARVLAAAAGKAIQNDPNLSDVDAIAAFVAEMNVQAAALGMTGSHFVNPDGWHTSDHYTTMADLLTLAQLCLEDPLILQVVKTPQYAANFSGRTVYWKNSNMHLKEDSPFYQPDCIGLKTGYTKAAGRCLLSAYWIDGRVIIAGVFGCPDPTYTYITQFQTNMTLYETYIRP
jgi:D-alanyl-D-alanine carboxypeptidase (penicillin-binding protein 5/6)